MNRHYHRSGVSSRSHDQLPFITGMERSGVPLESIHHPYNQNLESQGTEQEIYSVEELIEKFSLDRVIKAVFTFANGNFQILSIDRNPVSCCFRHGKVTMGELPAHPLHGFGETPKSCKAIL